MNHKSVFVNKIISNHEDEYLTKNRAETKNLYDAQPKNIFMLAILTCHITNTYKHITICL